MKVGFYEAMITPAEVVVQDLQFMGLESKYGQKQPEKDKRNKQRTK